MGVDVVTQAEIQLIEQVATRWQSSSAALHANGPIQAVVFGIPMNGKAVVTGMRLHTVSSLFVLWLLPVVGYKPKILLSGVHGVLLGLKGHQHTNGVSPSEWAAGLRGWGHWCETTSIHITSGYPATQNLGPMGTST